MTDINLLPQDLRRKEESEKERSAKKPSVLKVELSQPNNGALKEKNTKPSFWRGIFGPRRKGKALLITEQKVLPAKSNLEIDLLSVAKTPKKKIVWSSSAKAQNGVNNKMAANAVAKTSTAPEINLPAPFPVESRPSANSHRSELSTVLEDQPEKMAKNGENSYKIGSKNEVGSGKKVNKLFSIFPKLSEKIKLNINLAPKESTFIKRGDVKKRIAAVIVAIIIPAVVVYGVYLMIEYQQNKINEKLVLKIQQLGELKKILAESQEVKEQTVVLQQKLIALKNIFDNRIHWTKFFNLLEKYTLDGIYYPSFSGDIKGEISLPAVATSYGEIARQMVVFENAKDLIETVKVNSATLKTDNVRGITGVSAVFELKLAKDIFKVSKN